MKRRVLAALIELPRVLQNEDHDGSLIVKQLYGMPRVYRVNNQQGADTI